LVLPVGHTSLVSSAVFSPDGKLALTASIDNTARIYEVSSGKELQVLSGHTSSVNSAVFSPDGKLALTASNDKTARIYEVSTGKELKVLSGHSKYVTSAVFSTDGKLALTASDDMTAHIYEVSSGKELQVLRGHKGWLNSAVFSPDGKLALSASGDKTARIYEVSTGKELQVLSGHTDFVTSAVFSPDGKMALTASHDFTARIYEVSSGKELQVLSGHTKTIKSAVFSPDGKLVLTASYDRTARIYEVSTGKELQVLSGHAEKVTSAVFSPDGKLAITTCGNPNFGVGVNTARIYEVSSGKELKVLCGHKSSVNTAIFSPDGKLVLTASEDKTARIYEVSSGKELQVLSGHTSSVNSAVFSHDGKLALTASDDFTARIYEVSNGKELQVLSGHTSWLGSAVFSHDGKLVLTASWDKTARIYEVSSGKELQVLSWYTYTSLVNSAVFSHDGKLVLTASWDKTARIYEVSTGKELQVLSGHKESVNSAVFSPDGKLALTAGWDNTARIYEVSTGKELQVFSEHSHRVNSAVFSPDGKLVLTAGNNTARIYEVSSGKELQVLSGHKGSINTAVFSHDGKLVLTAGNNTARIYEVSSGKELQVFSGHTDWVTSAVFSPDGKRVLTTSKDHKTILWDVGTGKPLYTRLQLKGNDWLVYDEHYRFDGTPGAIEKLYFVCGLEVVELNQIKDSLYVPNLVQRIMNGENLDHLPKLSELNICGVTPVVEPLENDKSGNQGYRIIPRSGGVGDVDVYINGVVRLSTNAKKLKRKDGNYMLYVEKELLELYQIPGEELKVKVIAKTANNSISSRGVVIDIESDEKTTFKKPALHAIMIGVDDYKGDGLDLNYAAKDANDLQTVLQKSAQKFFNIDDTSRVHFYNLTVNRSGANGNEKIKGKTPDRTNIINTIAEIEKTSKPEDILLLFFAGHGEIVDKDQLLLLTSESSREDFKGLRMRELLELLNKVPAGKRVLILDACHSGAAINNLDMAQLTGKRDVKDAERQSQRLKELDKLASKSGFAIITASSSDQKALELPQYEHGLMTYALLNSMLNNKNALDEDNKLQLDKWLMATEEEVRKLNANQSAERMVPINFTLGKVDDEVRSSIVLKEIPLVYVKNVINTDLAYDNLEIESKLNEYFANRARGGDKSLLLASVDQTNATLVNILYTKEKNAVNLKITILKNNQVQKQFTKTGTEAQLNDLIKEIALEIEAGVK
jgi:WD40 repeat protein